MCLIIIDDPSFLTSWALFGSSTFCSQFSFSKLSSRNSFSQLKKPLTFAWHQFLVSRVFSPVIFQLKIHHHTIIIYHSRNISHTHTNRKTTPPPLYNLLDYGIEMQAIGGEHEKAKSWRWIFPSLKSRKLASPTVRGKILSQL